MFQKFTVASFFALLLIAGCAPKIRTNITQKYQPLDYQEEVWLLPKDSAGLGLAEVLGTVKVGDAGMTTNCSYTVVLEKAKEEARKSGGNAVRVIEHKTPDFMSSCHRITAEVLRINPEQIASLKEVETEADSLIDHAILYVYRNGGPGALVGYNLSLGDSVICRVTNKFRQKIEIRKEGAYDLWAKTESKASIPIDIRKGRTYYIRCGIGMGVMVGRPTLDLVDRRTGKVEYIGKKRK